MKLSHILLLSVSLLSFQVHAMDLPEKEKMPSKKPLKILQDYNEEEKIDKGQRHKDPVDDLNNQLQNIDINKNSTGEKNTSFEKYNSDDEYARHQKVSNRFFKRPSLKREMIREAREQLTSSTPINLDGLSSRTRIFLFRELTAFACTKQIKTIPFKFHNKDFQITLKPSLRQPGDGIISSIGTYQEIYKTIHSFTPEYQKQIAEKLIEARKAKPYHPPIPNPIISLEGMNLNLEMLNILLDFEVARRLQELVPKDQGTNVGIHIQNNEKINLAVARTVYANCDCGIERKIEYIRFDRQLLDEIPVASAIVGALILSTKAPDYELCLMSALPENKTPLKGKIYLKENETKKLDCIMLKPNSKVVKKTFDIDISHERRDGILWWVGDRELTPNILKTFNSEILQAATKKNLIETPELLEIFFHAPDNDSYDYKAGDFTAFEGKPDGGRRKKATKTIINMTRSGKSSTREDIHKEYLYFFGGGSDSDGDSYSNTDESD